MIRESRTKPKDSSENPKLDAHDHLVWGPGGSGIERLILDTSPLPMAAVDGLQSHDFLRQFHLLSACLQDQR